MGDGMGTTMATTMTMRTTMTLTTTMILTMTIDAMDGVAEVVMEGRYVASALMGQDQLVQTTRGQTSVLTAPYQPGSRLAQQEEDHDAQTTKPVCTDGTAPLCPDGDVPTPRPVCPSNILVELPENGLKK